MVKIVKQKVLLLVILTFSLLLATPVMASEEWDVVLQKEIEAYLVCQDDCGMILKACDNQTAEYMRGIIIEKLKAGQSKQEVLDHFVTIYGEKVLAAPPVKGFNITAWVVPFVAVIAGGLLIYFAVDKWVFHNRQDENLAVTEKTPKIDLAEYEDKLQEELKKYF